MDQDNTIKRVGLVASGIMIGFGIARAVDEQRLYQNDIVPEIENRRRIEKLERSVQLILRNKLEEQNND